MPFDPLAQGSPDLDRSFKLAGPDSVGLYGRSLWVDGVGGILSVDLTSILYTDGSKWHASSASRCHAIPNGFTPVVAAASR